MIIETNERGGKMEYGKKMLEFRAKHNLTQTKLADLLGITLNSIWRYENGVCKPSAMKQIQFENKMKEYEVCKNVF
jgi:transcriptional regulator with XRE-family HTH domain